MVSMPTQTQGCCVFEEHVCSSVWRHLKGAESDAADLTPGVVSVNFVLIWLLHCSGRPRDIKQIHSQRSLVISRHC